MRGRHNNGVRGVVVAMIDKATARGTAHNLVPIGKMGWKLLEVTKGNGWVFPCIYTQQWTTPLRKGAQ